MARKTMRGMGDVSGTTKTVTDRGLGPASEVAAASFDPNYSLETTLGAGVTPADLRYGYTDSGYSIGE